MREVKDVIPNAKRKLFGSDLTIKRRMKAQYIKHKKQWSAFTTLNGLDIQEYGNTEKEARANLATRISNSKFLMEGIKLPQ